MDHIGRLVMSQHDFGWIKHLNENMALRDYPPQEMQQFLEIAKPYHLTLGEIKQFPVGHKFEVVSWDRNYEEAWIWNEAIPMQVYESEVFFAWNRCTVTYKGAMEWTIKNIDGSFDHKVEIDVSNLDACWTWWPLNENGYLDINNEPLTKGQEILSHWKPKHLHWSELPGTTRVGWRGPMMYWEYLKDMPLVYYDKNAIEDD